MKLMGVGYLEMNLKKYLGIAFIISLVSLLGYGWMAILVSRDTIVNFDSTIISYVQGLEAIMLTMIMKFFSFIGDTIQYKF
jgi:undecaprenyl-diphosphatase